MKQYTAGTLADLAGVSARTIRYYDQKGLLRPVGYTESGYRLFDDGALLKLQQITMLKFAGFSLEDIQGLLLMEDRAIPEILEDQRQLLLERRDRIDEVIALLDDVLAEGSFDDLAQLTESMKLIRRVNHSGRVYRYYDQHETEKLYPWEFDQLDLKPGMHTLDLGCGYALLWRQSWQRIPEQSQITLVDIYGQLLDQVRGFVSEHADQLSPGTRVLLKEADAETLALPREQYDRCVMAYLWKYCKDPQALLGRVHASLKPGGMLCLVSGGGHILDDLDAIYQDFAGQGCLEPRKQQVRSDLAEIEGALGRVFPRVELVTFDNELSFDHPLELYRLMMDSYDDLSAAIRVQGVGFVNFLRRYVAERGPVTLHSQVRMYRCYKEEAFHDNP